MALATVPIMGASGKLMVKKAVGGTWKTVRFVTEGLRCRKDRLKSDGIRGTRSQEEAMSAEGPSHNGGPLSMIPNQLEMEQFLTHILGGTEVGNAWALAEALVDDLYVERWDGAGGHTFANGCAKTATWRSTQGGLLRLDLDLAFRTAADLAAATAQSMLAGLPYTHAGLVLTLGGVAYRCKDLMIKVDNAVKDDHRNNSNDLQEFPTGDRIVTVEATLPYSAATEDFIQYVMKTTTGECIDLAATAVYTNPDTKTCTFSFPRLQVDTEERNIGGKDTPTDLKIVGQALASATRNDEMTVTMSA